MRDYCIVDSTRLHDILTHPDVMGMTGSEDSGGEFSNYKRHPNVSSGISHITLSNVDGFSIFVTDGVFMGAEGQLEKEVNPLSVDEVLKLIRAYYKSPN